MKTSYVKTILIIASLTSSTVLAQGWYVSAGAGMYNPQDADTLGGLVDVDYDGGTVVGLAVGHSFASGLRLEEEISYRKADVDTFGAAGMSTSAGGDINTLSLMTNFWYDVGGDDWLTPYWGGGIGLVRVAADDVRLGEVAIVDDSDVVAAIQIGVGLAVSLTPSLSLTIDYRMMETTDPTLINEAGTDPDIEYGSHDISVGLRYAFQ